jgi:hypothetical protein
MAKHPSRRLEMSIVAGDLEPPDADGSVIQAPR